VSSVRSSAESRSSSTMSAYGMRLTYREPLHFLDCLATNR
jgi:hypothetical protein